MELLKRQNSKMDLKNIPEFPKTDEEYGKCFSAFLKAVNKKNENLINLLMRKEGILEREFYWEKETFLHVVTKCGTTSTAIQLCKLGPSSVNIQNKRGETPIYHAIKHSSEMVKILLDNGAKVNILCKKGVTPLHQSLLCGSEETVRLILNKAVSEIDQTHHKEIKTEEIVKTLLNRQSELKFSTKDLPLLIFFTAKICREDIFNLTLQECRKSLESASSTSDDESTRVGRRHFYRQEKYSPRPPEELNIQGHFGRTALHYAVREQLPEVVRFLLKKRADVNCKSHDGFTPLHYAACLENQEICEILLSFGAQVDPNSPRKGNPLYLVCGRSEARNLLKSGDGYHYEEYHNTMINRMNSFYEPQAIFNPKIMKLLLRSGAGLDIPGDEGTTPLLEACRGGKLEAVKILLRFGANLRALDGEKNSALHYAATGNSLEIVELLLKKGIDVEIRNVHGYTPLLCAAQNERQTSLEMIEYLVDCGGDVNARNAGGATALHIAAYFDWKDVVECLLELGADVTLKYNLDVSPVLGNILSSMYFFGLGAGRKLITSFIALKESDLGDYIHCYIRDEHGEFQEAVEHFEKSKLELEKMKVRKICDETRISFHDFLTRDFYNAVQIAKKEETREVFKTGDYKEEFPCYGYMLERRFERVEDLKKSVDMAEEFMSNYGQVPLSNLVIRKILSHLRSTDFRIFGRILTRR